MDKTFCLTNIVLDALDNIGTFNFDCYNPSIQQNSAVYLRNRSRPERGLVNALKNFSKWASVFSLQSPLDLSESNRIAMITNSSQLGTIRFCKKLSDILHGKNLRELDINHTHTFGKMTNGLPSATAQNKTLN